MRWKDATAANISGDFRRGMSSGLASVGLASRVSEDTPEDLKKTCRVAQRRGTPIWVRLVKGAYWDFWNR